MKNLALSRICKDVLTILRAENIHTIWQVKKMLRYRFLNFCVILLKINPAIALFLPLPASQNLASILFRNVQRTFFKSNKFELTPASTLTIKAKNKIIYAYWWILTPNVLNDKNYWKFWQYGKWKWSSDLSNWSTTVSKF